MARNAPVRAGGVCSIQERGSRKLLLYIMYIIGVLTRGVRRRERGFRDPSRRRTRSHGVDMYGLGMDGAAVVASGACAVRECCGDPHRLMRPGAQVWATTAVLSPGLRGSPTEIRRFLLLSVDHAVRNRHGAGPAARCLATSCLASTDPARPRGRRLRTSLSGKAVRTCRSPLLRRGSEETPRLRGCR